MIFVNDKIGSVPIYATELYGKTDEKLADIIDRHSKMDWQLSSKRNANDRADITEKSITFFENTKPTKIEPR